MPKPEKRRSHDKDRMIFVKDREGKSCVATMISRRDGENISTSCVVKHQKSKERLRVDVSLLFNPR